MADLHKSPTNKTSRSQTKQIESDQVVMVVGNSDGRVHEKEAEEIFASENNSSEQQDSIAELESYSPGISSNEKFNKGVRRLDTQQLDIKNKITIEEMKPGANETANKNFLRTSNFGFDLSKIKNLHDLFDLKMKAEGPSKDEQSS